MELAPVVWTAPREFKRNSAGGRLARSPKAGTLEGNILQRFPLKRGKSQPLAMIRDVGPSAQRLAGRIRRSTFLRDASMLVYGVLVAQVIGLAVSPLLTRLFSPADFGVFSIVTSLAAIVSVFATLRLETIVPAVRTSCEALRLVQVMVGSALACSVSVVVLLLFFASDIARLLQLPEAGKIALWGLPALVLAFAMFSGVRAWCIRTAQFAVVSRGQVMRALAATTAWLVGGIAALASAPGLMLTLGQVVADYVFAGLLWRRLRQRELRLLLTPRWHRIRGVLASNGPMVKTLVSSQMLAAVYSRLPALLIGVAFGPVQAGYYAMAERLVAAPAVLAANSIGDVYRQRASAAYRAGQPFDQLMRRVLALIMPLGAIAFTVAILASLKPGLVGAILGQQWEGAGMTFAILLVGAFFAFISTPVDKAAIIVGADRYILLWHVLRLVAEVVATALALTGLIGYQPYLCLLVAARSSLYLWDLIVEHRLASCGA